MFRKMAFWLVLLSCWTAVTTLQAQCDTKERTYNEGVHAYFAGDYQVTQMAMDRVIDAKTIDPRPYFFRGLALWNLQKVKEARADFARGAELEMASTNRFFDISRALLRVQGKSRLAIEKERRHARQVARELKQKKNQIFYESTRLEESRVLRKNLNFQPAGIH